MNANYKSDKEPIELLLGLGGAVQYLEHAPKDDLNYSVWVKTKTGKKLITIPIEAVKLIQSKKPTNEIVDLIKRQLTVDSSSVDSISPSQREEPTKPGFSLWQWLPSLFRARK